MRYSICISISIIGISMISISINNSISIIISIRLSIRISISISISIISISIRISISISIRNSISITMQSSQSTIDEMIKQGAVPKLSVTEPQVKNQNSTTTRTLAQVMSQNTQNRERNVPNNFTANNRHNNTLPRKEQGICIQTVNGVTTEDCVLAIGAKIGPANIISASRISLGRVCMYLSNTTWVELLTKENQNKIQVNDTSTVEVRPLVAKTKRVVFSNVHSTIPNGAITQQLHQFNVNPKSEVTILRAGFNQEGYTHIQCFRRQVYVEPSDIDKIPSQFTISHEGTLHHIFVTTDTLTCFICKQTGHISKHCPTQQQQSTYTNTATQSNAGIALIEKEKPNEKNNVTVIGEINNERPLSFMNTELFAKPINNVLKRNRATSNTNTDMSSAHSIIKTSKKKAKTARGPPDDLEQQIKEYAEKSQNQRPLDVDFDTKKLEEFIKESYKIGYKEVPELLKNTTSNTEALLTCLQEFHRFASTNLKKRITRILNTIKGEEVKNNNADILSTSESEAMESDWDASQLNLTDEERSQTEIDEKQEETPVQQQNNSSLLESEQTQ